MPSVLNSTVLDAPPTSVWTVLRDFTSISSWHPFVGPCEIVRGPADRPGCSRIFPAVGGHRETLTGLDDRSMTISYAFDDSAGLPVRDYLCTMRVRPVTGTGGSYVEWRSEYDCDAADEAAAVAQIQQFLEPGLTGLARYLAEMPMPMPMPMPMATPMPSGARA